MSGATTSTTAPVELGRRHRPAADYQDPPAAQFQENRIQHHSNDPNDGNDPNGPNA
jgi:hypothetical protein